MKKIDFLQKAEFCVLCLVVFLILIATMFVSFHREDIASILLYTSLGFAVLGFALYIRKSYLLDKLPKEKVEELKTQKKNADIEQAKLYVAEEKFGHKSRFIRRFGDNAYQKLIDLGIIYCSANGKKWFIRTKKSD